MRSIALVLLFAGSASAQDLPIDLTVAPWDRYDGVDRPYRYIASVRAREPIDVVVDHRLVSLEVRPADSRRRLRCAHPSAPRRVPEGRVRALAPSEPWSEWIDLRMFCTGAALRALEGGGEVTLRYGFPGRATRTRWIARREGELVPRVELAARVLGTIAQNEETRRVGDDDPPRIHVALAPASARSESALTFRTSVRARVGTERVYVRPDAWSFLVRGPLGTVTCELEMGGGSPAPDLYRRVTERSSVRESLAAADFCPRGTFELAGIYEVTPRLVLEHSGEEYGLRAVTGTFEGPTVAIRITSGERGYIEQIPERARPRQ